MQMKKNEKGVTLIALATMIIVIIIIAAVTVYSGSSSIQDAKQRRLITELSMVQHAVLENYTQYKIFNDTKYLVGEALIDINKIEFSRYRDLLKNSENAFKSNAAAEDKYYKLNTATLEKMGLETPTFTYIVCYKTGEVMNAEVFVTAEDDPLYVSK